MPLPRPNTGLSWFAQFRDAMESRLMKLERPAAYTVATVPDATTRTSVTIYVSDESGGAVLAFSDGTNWRRVTDRAIIS